MTARGNGADRLERRARRLVRIYPPAWRERYGEEFVQYLIDDLTERPWSAARCVDVVRGGLTARAAYAGMSGDVLEPDRRLRAGLGASGLVGAGVVLLAVGVWSQLTVDWQWSAPRAAGARTGMLLMSVMMIGVLVTMALAVAPVLWAVGRGCAAGRARRLLPWLMISGVCAAALIVGSIHVGYGWPGTGGHAWTGHGLVPGPVARIGWAFTLWITSYWAHPGALSAFPTGQLAWMLIGPLLLGGVLFGVIGLLRRLELPARVLAYEAWVGLLAVGVMAGLLAGAASWVVSGTPGPRGLFRIGVIDVVAVLVMAGGLVSAWRLGWANLVAGRRLADVRR